MMWKIFATLVVVVLALSINKGFLQAWARFPVLLFNERKACKGKNALPTSSCKKETVTVYFIRHGQSMFNVVSAMVLFNLVKLWFFIKELLCLWDPTWSALLDTPLTKMGVDQAGELQEAIFAGTGSRLKDFREAINNLDETKFVFCVSNLRRAVTTLVVALGPRFQKYKDEIHVLSCLQESTAMVDTYALTRPKHVPKWLDSQEGSIISSLKVPTREQVESSFPRSRFVVDKNYGTKGFLRNARKDMENFCEWCFSAKNAGKAIVCAGHSFWFQGFFESFIPNTAENEQCEARMWRMGNCSLVRFELTKEGHAYSIDPSTIQMLHGEFEKKSKIRTDAH